MEPSVALCIFSLRLLDPAVRLLQRAVGVTAWWECPYAGSGSASVLGELDALGCVALRS